MNGRVTDTFMNRCLEFELGVRNTKDQMEQTRKMPSMETMKDYLRLFKDYLISEDDITWVSPERGVWTLSRRDSLCDLEITHPHALHVSYL